MKKIVLLICVDFWILAAGDANGQGDPGARNLVADDAHGVQVGDLEPESGIYSTSPFEAYDILVSRILIPDSDASPCWTVVVPALVPAVAVLVMQEGERGPGTVVVRRSRGDLTRYARKQVPMKPGKLPHLTAKTVARLLANVDSKIVEGRASLRWETTDLLVRLWEAALSRVRYPARSRGGVMDGVTYHFGRSDTLAGLASSPTSGTIAKGLASIAQRLVNFVEVEASGREAADRDLQAECKKLLARIEQLTTAESMTGGILRVPPIKALNATGANAPAR